MKRLFTNAKNVIAALVVTTFLGTSVSAQLAMTRSTFTGAYTAIVGGTTSTATGDDAYQQNIPVGFTFNYLGTPYTQFSVSTNGWLSFANGATFDAYSPDLYSTTTNAVVAPWWDDLTTSAIVYQTTGSVGSQVCTIQWTSLSYYFTSTRTINYQVKLYEGTNVIEFWYGAAPTGTINTSESASIGLKSATGGNGQYLDAVTGSAFTGNSSLQSDRWPSYNFRFTPGAPTPLPAGTYNVGVGQTYRNLNEAAAEINHRGIAGAVTFNLVDAQYDVTVANGGNFFPILIGPVSGTSAVNTVTFTKSATAAIVSYGGASGTNGAIANQASTTALASNVDPIIGLVGADYITLNNLDIRGNVGNNTADHGIGVYNSSATDGSTNNIISNVSVQMARTNTGSRGFMSNVITTPTSAAGANSNNTYRNFTIRSVYAGIQFTGNATNPDVNNVITNTVCTSFNTIGDPSTANDIGNGTTQTYGVRLTNQSGFTLSNNSIRNVTGSGVQTDGILIETFQGTSTVANNKVQTVRNASTSSTTGISGIRMTHTTTGTHTLRVYNNTVSEIISSYTGVASTARTLKGIFISGAGGATTQTYEIYNNSVSMDGSASLNVSSSCFEVNTTSGPVYSVGNNIFSNTTAAQGATSRHYGIVSPSATLLGNTGTTSNNNDIYVANDIGTSGFTALGGATTYNTVANWTAATTLDAASISTSPSFASSPSNLHATALGLNGAAMAPPAYITLDQECASRTPDNDIGAYVIAACSGMPTAGTITGVSAVCSGSGTTLTLTGASSEAGIVYQWASSTTNGGPYTTMLGTATTQATGPLTVTTYYVVGVGCSVSGMGTQTIQFTVAVNPLPPVTVNPTSATYCVGGPGLALSAGGASTYSWSPSTGLSATTGANVTATPTASITYTVTGTDGLGCSATASSTVTVGYSPIGATASANPTSVCFGGNSQLTATATSGAPWNQYTFSTSTGATLDPMTGATQVLNPGNDDTPTAAPAAIGFTFPFNGTTYTQYSVSPDGWILLGGATAVSQFTNATTSTTNTPKISPMWDDLATGTDGNVKTLVTGTAPFRVFIVQWFVTSPRNTAGPANATFQCWMYETTGVIEFRYGTLAASGSASCGGTASATNYQSVTFTTNTVSTSVANDANAAAPASGRMYTFTPPALSYAWTPATFLNNPAIYNPMASGVTATTTYTVVPSSGTCAGTSATVTVTTGAALSASASVSPASSVCAGTAVTLNGTPAGGGAPYTYSWTGPNSFSSTVQNPSLGAATLAMAGTYTLVVNDGCASSFTTTVTLAVNGAPTIAVTPTSGTYCSGGPAVALAASGSSTSYSWGPAAGLSSTTGANVTASPSSSTTYTVTGTDGNGCTNTATAAITSGLTPNVTSSSSPAAVCPGGSATLNSGASFTLTYCQPVYSTGTTFGDYVSNVVLNTLSNATVGSATPYYTLYPASGNTTTTLTAGTTYTITLTAGTYTSNDLAAWIDFDQNGTLNNPGEKLGETDNVGASPASTSFVFTVPLTASNGATRLRVRDMDHGTSNDMDPCAPQSIYGETEDYVVTIVGGVDIATFTWSPGTFLSSTTGASVNATGATATTTYTVTGTTAIGCTSTSTVTLTVNPLPTITASASANPTCVGASETLTGGGGVTYTWSGGVTDNVAFSAPSPAGAYSYTVTGTDVNGCTNTASITITVNALPVVAISGPTAICAGDTATLNGSSGGTSQWYMNGSPIVGATSSTYLATAAGVYNMTKTNLNGCTDSSATSHTLVVNALPTVTASATPLTACAGDMVTATGSGATTYAWSGGITDNVPFAAIATMTYTVTGTDGNGCDGIDSVTVTVNALPTVAAMSSDTNTCMNDMVTFMGMGATSYTWNNGVTDGVPYMVTVSDTFIVTGTDGNGCMNTDTLMITVNALPVVTASVTDTLVCAGDSVTFMGGGAASYAWDNGVTDNVPYAAMSSMTYNVIGTDANGCTGSASVTVNVNALPNVTVTLPMDTACLLLGPVTLSGESPAGGVWSGPGVTGNSFNPGAAGNGTHAIMYTYTDSITGCSATAIDSILVDICNGINVNENGNAVLYPNPNNGDFTLIPSGSGLVDVMIYSATGQLVSAEKATAGQPNKINIAASGMYSVVIVTADGQRTTQRVIVNR